MRSGQDVPSHDAALDREWLLADERGGSASGTAAGALTRRTHGLLVVAGPHGRLTTLLLRLDERAQAPGGPFELGVSFHAGGVARPSGHQLIESFDDDPWPCWRYRLGEVRLEKSLFVVGGHPAVAVRWRLLEGPAVRLTVSPLVVARDPGDLQHEDPRMRGAVQGVPGRVRIETLDGGPALTLWHDGAFLPARAWQRRIHHPLDASAATEDAFVPGYVEGSLEPGSALHVVCGAEPDLFRALAAEDRLGAPPPRTLAGCVAALAEGERGRGRAWRRQALAGAELTARQAAAARAGAEDADAAREPVAPDHDDPRIARLASALAAGLARRAHRTALVSTLPAARERGADALRAVPALIALRAFDAAREVLRGHLEYLDEGLAPEGFDPDDGVPRYGDAEPALWLVHAADLYARRSEDLESLRDPLYPTLEAVMHFYRSGTRGGIRVDATGLLLDTEDGRARADLNALWYHALVAMAQLARLIGRRESGAFYLAWAREHRKRFVDAFWNEDAGALHESVGPGGPVAGLGPSQLLAVSLPPALLPHEQAERLLATVGRELATPWGLRDRPGASTVRPEWLGAYGGALLRLRGRSAEAQDEVRGSLERVLATPGRHVPERFVLADGGARPDGEPASIPAAAELLRLWVEELAASESALGVG